jgi:hypothetical protein
VSELLQHFARRTRRANHWRRHDSERVVVVWFISSVNNVQDLHRLDSPGARRPFADSRVPTWKLECVMRIPQSALRFLFGLFARPKATTTEVSCAQNHPLQL